MTPRLHEARWPHAGVAKSLIPSDSSKTRAFLACTQERGCRQRGFRDAGVSKPRVMQPKLRDQRNRPLPFPSSHHPGRSPEPTQQRTDEGSRPSSCVAACQSWGDGVLVGVGKACLWTYARPQWAEAQVKTLSPIEAPPNASGGNRKAGPRDAGRPPSILPRTL